MIEQRRAAILRAVIEEYIKTAMPVGSSAVVEAAMVSVSAATIRNDMAALENEGYLHQPHTSAGRIPTERGYRHFVDNLIEAEGRTVTSQGLAGSGVRSVSSFFGDMQGEIEQIMQHTAGLLADMTNYAAVVVDDNNDSSNVRSVQLVNLTEHTVMAVVVLASGQISKHTFDFDEVVDAETLVKATQLLRESFQDRPLNNPLELDDDGGSLVCSLALQFHQAIATSTNYERVYVEGTSKVAQAFDAVDSVRQVLSILEQQLVVVSLLADVVERGMSVVIGSETGVEPLSECSLVVSPYEVAGERAGSIAVLGPTRMNYPQAMSTVAVVSDQLGKLLSEG